MTSIQAWMSSKDALIAAKSPKANASEAGGAVGGLGDTVASEAPSKLFVCLLYVFRGAIVSILSTPYIHYGCRGQDLCPFLRVLLCVPEIYLQNKIN